MHCNACFAGLRLLCFVVGFVFFGGVGSAGLDRRRLGEFNNSFHFISTFLKVLPPTLGTRGRFLEYKC